MNISYKSIALLIGTLISLATARIADAQVALPWSDNFESYADATVLNGVNGWKGWNNTPGFAASTTTAPPAPLPNSAALIDATDDAVVHYTPATTGQWLVQFRQFIPSDFAGTSYVVMLNQYDDACATCSWSLQVQFASASGQMTDDGASAASQAYVTDQWVDIEIAIDLDLDSYEFFYNGSSFYTGTWSNHLGGVGIAEIAALDLYANGATAVYYDDISITQVILPVELTSFAAVASGNDVELTWSTASETNNAGFSIERKDVDGRFTEVGYVEGRGTTNEPQDYRFTVNDLDPGAHRFRLKQIDYDGAFEYSQEVEAVLTVPDRLVIEPAYPNPFNPSTSIRFAVASEQNVKVTLVNVMGQPVRTLYDGTTPANEMQTLSIDASGLPSGAYLVHFRGNGALATQRIILTK